MSRACLFDLDGVLVRSEEIHHLAYQQLCAAHGEPLDWGFERYCLAAHYGPEHLQLELRRAVPRLFDKQPSWEALYREKSRLYLELLDREEVPMQPGATALLERLRAGGAPHAIVTNSTREQTARLRRRHPPLDRVPLWITREAYTDPKPAPDAYIEAMRRLDRRPDECLGFEDTPRGLRALVAAGVPAVLVTTVHYPNLGVAEPPLRIDNLAELPPRLLH